LKIISSICTFLLILNTYDEILNKNKSPKLYFYDSGLLCTLLGIQSPDQLEIHSNRGGIFEGWVISELLKGLYNQHRPSNVYFWRDHKGLEVDVVVEHANSVLPIEIKSGTTLASDWFDSLKQWQALAKDEAEKSWLVYGGNDRQSRTLGEVLPWNLIGELLEKI
jgi:predicted AAA+ superfamily ATPase